MEKKYEIRLRYLKKIVGIEKLLKDNNIEYTENNNTYILTKGDSIADPGYFYLVLKSQAKKIRLKISTYR